MGFKDMNRAFKIDLPNLNGMTMLAARSVLNIVAAATDDKTHETFVSRATIAKRTGAGESTVKRALDALEALGLISRQIRYRENGSHSSNLIRFTPEGFTETPVGFVEDQGGVHGDPLPPFTENPPGVQGDPPIYQSEDQSEDQSSSSAFQAFWNIWPRKLDWTGSREAWNEATKDALSETILAAARAYAENPAKPETRYIPGPAKWLSRKGWLETLAAPSPQEEPRKRYRFDLETAEPMQTVQPGSDCGPRRHLRQPDGTCRLCEQRDIPEWDAWEPPKPRTIPKNEEWMY